MTLNFTRREFFTSSASGLGALALVSLLNQDGLLATEFSSDRSSDPLTPKAPHFAPRAKRCIFLFMDGGPSQLDLFDPKPKLAELNGQQLPQSLLENVRFAFIKKDATLRASPRKFQRYGQCGMELSDLLPHIGACADDICLIRSLYTDQFNHHPAQLTMQCGRGELGLPVMGSWLTYGLGSESQDLPAYVVLTGGRGTSGSTTLWSGGFLGSHHAGVHFRTRGEAVLNLQNPPGMPRPLRRIGMDTLRALNEARHAEAGDPEIASRIASYELAFRMQAAALELNDLSSESQRTLDMYGVERDDAPIKVKRDGGPGQYRDFATNCLLARRLVERGLLDETLVVWGSEFGRTPLSQGSAGRDHHPYAFSMFLAGGGTRGGYVHGRTDDIGWAPVEDAFHVGDLHATLLHLFGLDHRRLTFTYQGLEQRLTTVTRQGHVEPRLLA